MSPHIPIHDDKALTDEWWAAHGLQISAPNGLTVYRNTIRDASGRFDGYIVVEGPDFDVVKTVAEANATLQKFRWEENP